MDIMGSPSCDFQTHALKTRAAARDAMAAMAVRAVFARSGTLSEKENSIRVLRNLSIARGFGRGQQKACISLRKPGAKMK